MNNQQKSIIIEKPGDSVWLWWKRRLVLTSQTLDGTDDARRAEQPTPVTVTAACRHPGRHVALSRQWLAEFASSRRGRQTGPQEDRQRGCQRQ